MIELIDNVNKLAIHTLPAMQQALQNARVKAVRIRERHSRDVTLSVAHPRPGITCSIYFPSSVYINYSLFWLRL